MLCDCAHAVPHCPTMLCLSPAVLCAVSPMLCMSSPCMPEVVVGNAHTPADLSQIGVLTNPYQRETKPKTMWSCMWNTLPNLTKFLCSRCETHWCFWLGAGTLTNTYQSTLLAVPRYRVLLPIITGLVINIICVHNWQDTHMISTILLYLLIVAGLAYASYLKADLNRWK